MRLCPIHAHLELLKEQKKLMTKEQKDKLKAVKTELEATYGFCLLDGRREKVGNFRIEPPGLFRGRGKHPKAGKLKRRVAPEQVTINIGPGTLVPVPPPGHRWAAVQHDPTVTWLATWVENINRSQKYVFLAANSSLKAQSDYRKFETARKLRGHVGTIRRANGMELRSKETLVRQRATALWLIDHLALRAGNEKGDDEADTVGCCSLRLEHVRLEPGNTLVLDFLGKDSIRYYNSVQVDPLIFKNMALFMRPPKTASDPVFDRLTTAGLNKYLNGLMPGLTAKVFRTFNASWTFQEQLRVRTGTEEDISAKVLAYNRANREVAILCNHQRAVPKTHSQAMERMREKVLALKYQRYLVKRELHETYNEHVDDESEMDEETVARRAAEEAAKLEEKELKKNKDGSQEAPQKSSQSALSSPIKKRAASQEALQKKLVSLGTRIAAAKTQLIDRDENKTTALGTSKINYIDPRITVSWCRQHEVPVEKMFNKSLREKFRWAMSVAKTWLF